MSIYTQCKYASCVYTVITCLSSDIRQLNVSWRRVGGLPCAQTDEHLELSVLADVSGRAVDGAHEAAEVAHSGLPVFIWSRFPLLRTFKVHL